VKFTRTRIEGVVVVDLEPHVDERGFFARSFCAKELAAAGLTSAFVQANISFNREAGTLRGMHWQAAPHEEAKLVRCTRGRIHDVAVDMRPQSKTLHQWVAVELDADTGRALYIAEGCAHGYLTLTPDAEVHYLVSSAYESGAERGARWDDPALAIEWPSTARRIVSARDQAHPLLRA
jgi:dTDP-4-dehydrorhamnose 3,5-epimerase